MEKIPTSITKLINEVNEERYLTSSRIADLLNFSSIKMNDLFSYVKFDHPQYESYGRKMIWNGGFFKLMLMTWNPGDFTAAHDHGAVEWGAVKCFGEFKHIIYNNENNTLKVKSDNIIPDGTVAKVNPDLIHQMGNNSKDHIFSLHLYGSNSVEKNISRNSRIFDITNNKIVITDGQAFLDLQESLVKKIVYGLNPDIEALNKDKYIKFLHSTNSNLISI